MTFSWVASRNFSKLRVYNSLLATASSKYFLHNTSIPSKAAVRSLPTARTAGFFLSVITGSGLILYTLKHPTNLHAEALHAPAEIKFEEPRKKASSREENLALISSQHLQVKKSWENPGVYAWGNNTGRVIEDSDEPYVKTAKRIPYFDGNLIRDIKVDKDFGVAINENGDLLQWGTGFSPECHGPTLTLRGKNLVKISISKNRIIALSSSGKVYSVSARQSDHLLELKKEGNSWFRFWEESSNVGHRTLEPADFSWGEKIIDISCGLEHCLFLTSKGRLFSAAPASGDFPCRGQLGVPGLTFNTRPAGPFDLLHEIKTLKGFDIEKIAAGDFHSLALDKQGRVFTFGDNSFGQLGFEYSSESPIIDAPSLLPVEKLYKASNLLPKVTGIAAGGTNSFFTVDASRIVVQDEEDPRNLGRITADTWSCGQGILGGLGNGRWTHIQGTPTKIRALSGLFEYDEDKGIVIPIRLAKLSVGQTHMSAVMNNVTYLNANEKSSLNDTNWGADILFWGGNEHYQLGTGKRNNISQPVYIQPLDISSEMEKGRRELHRFQITPRKEIHVNGRKVSVEQRVECGRGVTVVYSGT